MLVLHIQIYPDDTERGNKATSGYPCQLFPKDFVCNGKTQDTRGHLCCPEAEQYIYFVTVLLSGVLPDKRLDGVPWTQDDTDRRKLHGKPYSMFTMGFGFWVLLHPAATSSSQFEWGSQFRKEPQQ